MTKRKRRRRNSYDNFLKDYTDITKLAVTGLVGASLIGTTGAAVKNLTKK